VQNRAPVRTLLTMAGETGLTWTGTLNADGSFTLSFGNVTLRGVFATEGGRIIIRDGTDHGPCSGTFEATKQ
jgi:hypothetical protein